MSKKLIWIVGIVALGIAGTLAFRSRSQPDNRIRISGNMELTQVNIAFKISGKLIERTVDEGDPVKKGQIIARLDRDQLERQRDREKAGLVWVSAGPCSPCGRDSSSQQRSGLCPPSVGREAYSTDALPPPWNSRTSTVISSDCAAPSVKAATES